MKRRHILQLRRIEVLLRSLAGDEERRDDMDAAEMLLYLSHHVRDAADSAEEQQPATARLSPCG
jgi:hypothetical protein